jgi:cysteine-rich repeat protein
LPVIVEAVFDNHNYSCIWEESSGSTANISLFADSQIGLKQPVLLILGSTLSPGVEYQFKVSLLLRSQIVTTASTSIRFNSAPSQGSCGIFSRDDAKAILSCTKWIDEDLPILYKFGFRSSSSNMTMEYSRVPNFEFFTFTGAMTVTASICDALLLCTPELSFFVNASSSFSILQEVQDARKLSSITNILSLGVAFTASLQSSNPSKSRTLLEDASTSGLLSTILEATVNVLKKIPNSMSFDATSSITSYLHYITRTSKIICSNSCLDLAIIGFERLVIVGKFNFKLEVVRSSALDCIGSFLDIAFKNANKAVNVETAIRINSLSEFLKFGITKTVSEMMIDNQTPVISGSFDSMKIVTIRIAALLQTSRTFSSPRDSKNRFATFYLSSTFFSKYLLLQPSNSIIAASFDVEEIPWIKNQFISAENMYVLNSIFGLHMYQYLNSPSFATPILVSLEFESDALPYPESLWQTKLRVSSWNRSSSPKECSVINISQSAGKGIIFSACNQVNAIGIVVVPHATLCGNGYLESMEQCDDGNISPMDGCDEHCRIENKWKCFRTGTFKVEEFNPDTCRFLDVPHIFCPIGYFGSSCNYFLIPRSIQKLDVSSLDDNTFVVYLGSSTLRIYIPARAVKSNVSLTVRVYFTSALAEKPSPEFPEDLEFAEYLFMVEPYTSFLSEVQVEFISDKMFVHSNSNSSKIKNFLNPSSVAAYQQTEALCISPGSCEVQIGSLGSTFGSWAPFRSQTSNATSFTVIFSSTVLSKFSYMMRTPLAASVAPTRNVFDMPPWALILLICFAFALSACVSLLLWYRLRSHNSRVLKELTLKYSVDANILNHSSSTKLNQNLGINRTSLYVADESFSDDSYSSATLTQFSDDADDQLSSLEVTSTGNLAERYILGETCAAEPQNLSKDDGTMPHNDNFLHNCSEKVEQRLMTSAELTEEELDLNFLMNITQNPADSLNFDKDLIGSYNLLSDSKAKISMIYADLGSSKKTGSLLLSPRVAEEMKVTRQMVQSAVRNLPVGNTNLKQSRTMFHSKPALFDNVQSFTSSEAKMKTRDIHDFSVSKLSESLQRPTRPSSLRESGFQYQQSTDVQNSTPRASHPSEMQTVQNLMVVNPSGELRIVAAHLAQPDSQNSSDHFFAKTSSCEFSASESHDSPQIDVSASTFCRNNSFLISQSELSAANLTAASKSYSTRMAPRLHRSAKLDTNANASVVPTKDPPTQIHVQFHHDLRTASKLHSKSEPTLQSSSHKSAHSSANQSTLSLPTEDQISDVLALASPRPVAKQTPSSKANQPSITKFTANYNCNDEDLSGNSKSSPAADASSDQVHFVEHVSPSPKMVVSLTPHVLASVATESSVSATPIRFSYKKSEIVKDHLRRR